MELHTYWEIRNKDTGSSDEPGPNTMPLAISTLSSFVFISLYEFWQAPLRPMDLDNRSV